MSAINATFGFDPVVNCCGRVLLDSDLPRTIRRLLEQIVEDVCQASRQSSTLLLRTQKFFVSLASSFFMFGAKLVHEGDMVLVAGASVRSLCGLTHGASTT